MTPVLSIYIIFILMIPIHHHQHTSQTSPRLVDAAVQSIVIFYSYIMLIEPASKVSVPLTVVMRTLSITPENVLEPANIAI